MARRNAAPGGSVTAPVAAADTRDQLKQVAMRLFAQRGVDGVTVRDIVNASGQRNAASIHYYFGTKEALVRELILDGAQRIDDRRHAQLDALEAGEGPVTLRQVLKVLVDSSFADGDEGAGSYLQFIAMLRMQHRDVFIDVLDDQWNSAYQRALKWLERYLDHLPRRILKQRLAFMGIYLGAALAEREAAMADPQRQQSSLKGRFTLENLVDTLEAMLLAPPSAQTMAEMPA
jgi:AcrR family transcriptional regulator